MYVMRRRVQFRRFVLPPIAGVCVAASWAAAGVLTSPASREVHDPAIRWTAVVAAALWCGAALFAVYKRRPGRGLSRPLAELARWPYAAGCYVYLLHVAVAFHAGHGWSHAAAVDHVERESGFGPGLFVSYLFTLVWVIDAGWCLIELDCYRSRPLWLTRTIHGFMAFVIFNATVVYASGTVRWGFAGIFFLMVLLLLRAIQGPHSRHEPKARCRQSHQNSESPIE